MTQQPRALDLFCGAGGAGMGLHQAGFDVVGVDIKPQPRYPFEFHQADALTFPLDGFDFIWASPPCHDHSNVTGRDRKAHGPKGTGWMLRDSIERLSCRGIPFIVENVESAATPKGMYAFRLCGSSFGLDIRRHRRFVSNALILSPDCSHAWQKPRFRSLCASRSAGGDLACVVGVHGNLNYAGEREVRERAMGIDWMTPAELTQAIPPAYSRYIAEQMLPHVLSRIKERAA